MLRRNFLKTFATAFVSFAGGFFPKFNSKSQAAQKPVELNDNLTFKKFFDTKVWYLNGKMRFMEFADGTQVIYEPCGTQKFIYPDGTRAWFKNDEVIKMEQANISV